MAIGCLGEGFDVQVLSNGTFIDSGMGDGNLYHVDVINIRLNQVAWNEYMDAKAIDPTDDDIRGPWELFKVKREARIKAWRQKVLATIGLEGCTGITLTQVMGEIFTVIHIYEKKPGMDD